MDHLPPCCASCTELDTKTRACRLLGAPSLPNRQRLLTMPCDVARLIRARFRGHGEDIVGEAMTRWLDPAWTEPAIVQSFGDAPRDARLWLGRWPLQALVREVIEQQRAEDEEVTPLRRPPEAGDRALGERVIDALSRLREIDPMDYALVTDVLRDTFRASRWRASLGEQDAAVESRRTLAVYRFLVLFYGVLEKIEPREAREALSARRFSAGSTSEAAALTRMRDALKAPDITLMAFRAIYREGALTSLAELGKLSAFGPGSLKEVEKDLRRALRIDDGAAP